MDQGWAPFKTYISSGGHAAGEPELTIAVVSKNVVMWQVAFKEMRHKGGGRGTQTRVLFI
jgi:hypothetical protein